MNKNLLSFFKCNQEIHRKWKQGQTAWNQYKVLVKVETQQEGPRLTWN